MLKTALVPSCALGLLAGAVLAAPFTVSGGSLSLNLPVRPVSQDVEAPGVGTTPVSSYLMGGIGMTYGIDQISQFVPGLYDALAGSTVIGGYGGVRDWANDPRSDTDIAGARPLWAGNPLGQNPDHGGWYASIGWVSTGWDEVFLSFDSAPGTINGVDAELYWMGQVALPEGVQLEHAWDGTSGTSWYAQALVNAEPSQPFEPTILEQLSFWSGDFVEHVDGSWSASAVNENSAVDSDTRYWYTFYREPGFEGGELYSLYLSDRPFAGGVGLGFETPTPGTLALLAIAPLVVRRRR